MPNPKPTTTAKRTQSRLPVSAERALLAAAFERAGVGLCLVDADNRARMANAQWLQSRGLTGAQVIGQDIFELFPEMRDRMTTLHTRALAGETVELPRYRQDFHGQETWWEGSASPVPLAEGAGTLISVRDVSAQVLAEREGERLRREMEEANQQLLIAGLRHQELAEQAELHRAQLNALLENLVEGVTIVDGAGRVALLNGAGKQLWQPPEDETWRTVEWYAGLDLRYPDGRPIPFAERPISRALRGERFADYEVLYVRPDGRQYRLTFSGAAVRDDAGQVVLALSVYRDVTELRQLERLREEYVGLISHDLRTPLTILMGQADWLRRALERQGLPREANSAAAIVQSSKRMNAMIQDLLESARLEAGQLELHKEPADLVHLASEIVERLGPPADRARIRVEAAEWVPPALADPDRIERAIMNLITNALKYSPPETPVVLRVSRRDAEAVIAIVDQGIGIAPEELPQLFQRFTRLQRSQQVEGVGLGLYITRLVVEAHGGRIWVESAPGKGSAFYFTLPLLPPDAGA